MIKNLFEKTVQYSKTIFSKRINYNLSNRKNILLANSSTLSRTSIERSLFFTSSETPFLPPMSSPTQIIDHELRDRAHKICCEYLGGAWKRIYPSDMSMTPLSGGMSNLLYCCALPESIQLLNGEPSQVLLRLYGKQSQNCDMSTQVQIFKLLSMKELGPKLYGDFEGGRLEEFLPANSLTCEELMCQDISAIIARKLASIHSLDVPIRKDRTWIVDRFREWFLFIKENVKSPQLATVSRESTIEIANELLAIDFGEEIKFLSKLFDGTPSPIVFSHNDLHQGNILLTKPSKRRPVLEKRMVLIDFEYCSYNYRAYDIANHFCEWCFEYDTPEFPHFSIYEDRFPSKAIQGEFIRNYLDQQKRILIKNREFQNGTKAKISSSPLTSSSSLNGMSNNRSRNSNSQTYDISNGHRHNIRQHSLSNGVSKIVEGLADISIIVTDEEIEAILSEVKLFCLAANLIWTLWCVKSAHSSSIKFGYWEHAMARWKLYSSLKRSYTRDVLGPTQTNGIIHIPRV